MILLDTLGMVDTQREEGIGLHLFRTFCISFYERGPLGAEFKILLHSMDDRLKPREL
jgi:hypothetical protein